MIGSATLGQGSVPLASEAEGNGVTPPPPVIPLRYTLDLPLSFGQGLAGTDNVLPDDDGDVESFWLSPTIDADHATPAQTREWPLGVGDDTSLVQLIAQIDAANLIGDDAQLIVTINGIDSDAALTIPAGASTALQLSAEAAVYAPAGYKLGVRFAPGASLGGGSTLRCEARLRATLPTALPAPAPDMWLWLNTTHGMPDGVGDTLPFEDQSGRDHHATFAGAAVLIPNALDGLPVIDLPRSAPGGLTGAYISQALPAGGLGPNVPFSVALVCIPQDDQGGPAFVMPSDDVNKMCCLQVPWIDSEHGPPDVQKGYTYEKFLYPSQEFADVVDYTDQPCLFEFISEDGATLEIRINGVVRALVDDAILPWGNGARLYQIAALAVAPYFLKADIKFAEIIVRDVVTAPALALDRAYYVARFPSLGLPY